MTALLAGGPDQMAKIDLVAHPNRHFDMAAFAPEPTGPDADKPSQLRIVPSYPTVMFTADGLMSQGVR